MNTKTLDITSLCGFHVGQRIAERHAAHQFIKIQCFIKDLSTGIISAFCFSCANDGKKRWNSTFYSFPVLHSI